MSCTIWRSWLFLVLLLIPQVGNAVPGVLVSPMPSKANSPEPAPLAKPGEMQQIPLTKTLQVPNKARPYIGVNHQLRSWLHLLDTTEPEHQGLGAVIAILPRLPGALTATLLSIGQGTLLSFLCTLLLLSLPLLGGFLAQWYVKSLLRQTFPSHGESSSLFAWELLLPRMRQSLRFIVFVVVTLLLFFLLDIDHQPARLTFMAILLAIGCSWLLALLMGFFAHPSYPIFSALPFAGVRSQRLHVNRLFFTWYFCASILLHNLLQELGASPQVCLGFILLLGTLFFVLLLSQLYRHRQAITVQLAALNAADTLSAPLSHWFLFVLLYFLTVWLCWVSQLSGMTRRDNGALIISLLIIPLFFLCDRLGRWLTDNVIQLMGISKYHPEHSPEEHQVLIEREHKFHTFLLRLYRIGVVFVLGLWLLALWGVHLPLAINLLQAVFNILITLTLALFTWKIASGFIEKKLQEIDQQTDIQDEADDEFGGAVQRGRGYTLLPLLRKCIAAVLLLMVSLIILSALGVDIGPLLAGAGVIGLAVGFGAQKLVSDILSGLFYLLDDAFRVGEYIQAGALSGTVENITLRNVMLRHHRGMLQIVPHSEMGSITNFMRGGIVVKFNLEFPYDTDIDKVRKIIKRVGLAMLEDEELGSGFLQPLKSQGVYEISNSVMVIRVKYTAQPGKQFLIRREAFRRITEALAAKDIHYAHRKVIVEVPQDPPPSPEQRQQAIEAGAAAINAQYAAGENSEKKEESPFPGL